MQGPSALTRVRALLFRAAYNLPVTLGLARGLFARRGLAVEIAYTRGSQMVTHGLLAGDYDLGVLAADDVIYEVETHDADLFMFMGLHAGILTLVARPDIRTCRDVAGRRLGVDELASGFALVARRILHAAGVNHTEYETVAAGGHEHRARALLDGTIDVALLTPPFTVEAATRGFTTLARARDYLPVYQASCGVATRRWARAHEATLVAYITAYRESVGWALAPEHQAEATSHLAEQFGLSERQAALTYAALADPGDGLFRDAAVDLAGVQTVLDLRSDAGLLPARPRALVRYVDLRYFEQSSPPGAR
jgi:ABC-type nitrate/sulfonate/bicarbonate transport system substrate-binding protein